MKSLSIIIPCFNEYNRLSTNLPIIFDFCEKYLGEYELIFVNDGSTDDTQELLYEYVGHYKFKIISYGLNMGKGYAVRMGLKAATKDLVLFMDADLSTALSCILDALKYSKTLDKIYKNYIIIGNREVSDSIVIFSKWRQVIGRIFNNLQYLMLGLRVTDTQCGFKLMPKHIIPRIVDKLMIDGWAFDVELLYVCEQNNIFIDCMPVTWHDVVGSKINPVRDAYRMFIELIKIRIIHGGKNGRAY